ncbi:hypothetical protein QUB68_07650 [Microcoleus sp. A006_D1]|uniref:hypothetical protein n=1 Tax=Microcoleus sp. A006_D1 TaxID=3055267 RepID=UPI002FD2143C
MTALAKGRLATDFLTDLTDLTDGRLATDFLTDLTDGISKFGNGFFNGFNGWKISNGFFNGFNGWKISNGFFNGFNGWKQETGSAGARIVAAATLALRTKKIKK